MKLLDTGMYNIIALCETHALTIPLDLSKLIR